jgi:DNA mismatch repair protein MutS
MSKIKIITDKMSPGRKQYLEIKNKYNDCLLLFRMGDFYETFDEDAKKLSSILNIALTARDVGDKNKVPLAGIPHHSLDNYLKKLVDTGLKIAIAEQISDPKESKGIVDRAVTRVITPGTVTDPNLLKSNENNFLVSLYEEKNIVDICALDISTGKFETYSTDIYNIQNEIERLNPKEILYVKNNENIINEYFDSYLTREYQGSIKSTPLAKRLINSHFDVEDINQIGLENRKTLLMSLGIILDFIDSNQKTFSKNIKKINNIDRSNDLILDFVTLRDLEITKSISGNDQNTLFYFMDETNTAMGGRELRNWLITPTQDLLKIKSRHNQIEWIKSNKTQLLETDEILKKISDVERIINRVENKTSNYRDIISIYESIIQLPLIKKIFKSSKFKFESNSEDLKKLSNYLNDALDTNKLSEVQTQLPIKKGFNNEFDELIDLKFQSNNSILKLERKEKEASGINNLKISFNRVFGYYFEVTKSNLESVPDYFIRRQTLANSERFYTEELKILEEKILNADEKISSLENFIFIQICEEISKYKNEVLHMSNDISLVDTLYSLYKVSNQNNWIKPTLLQNNTFNIKDAIHPVIDKTLGYGKFVPNDLKFSNSTNTAIITGPNMSGKSTYLRTMAIIVILAQMGSFVPASKCEIGLVDRIFTRTGLTDDIHAGKSTFLIEMEETSRILDQSTNKSFAVLDEIGRGTSTYDGLSIAWSILEYINTKDDKKFRTLFATHFHELTKLPETYSNIFNLQVAVHEENNSINFLHRIIQGSSERSYGINVAEIAGIPLEVLLRAKILLGDFEKPQIKENSFQPLLFEENLSEITKQIRDINLNSITPIDLMNLIRKIQKEISKKR